MQRHGGIGGPSGYVQVPLDTQMSDEALEAKLAINLAAARIALERASDEELDALVEDAEAITAPAASPGDREAIGAHVEATERFHAIEHAGGRV